MPLGWGLFTVRRRGVGFQEIRVHLTIKFSVIDYLTITY